MAELRQRISWDASVFLEYVAGDDPARMAILAAPIDRAGPDGDIELVTSVLSAAEVAFMR